MITKHNVIAAEVVECATWAEVNVFLHDHDALPNPREHLIALPVGRVAKGGDCVTYWERNQMFAVLKIPAGFQVVRVRYDKQPGGVTEPTPAK